jgi:alpha-tubulin suppressor-like RCC1 family protein
MQYRFALVTALALAAGCGDDVPDVAPRIVVLSPDDGAVLATTSAALQFRVEDAAAVGYDVRLGDAAPATVDEPIAIGGEATVPLTLVEGINSIDLTVRAETGMTATETIVLVVELAPAVRPSVAILSPAHGALLASATAELELEITEAAATGLRIEIGDAAPIELAESIAAGTTRTVEVTLADGVNTIEVAALDAAGVAGTDSAVVVVDAAVPVVEITAPTTAELTYAAAVAVAGRITTARALTAATVRVDAGAPVALALEATPGGYAFTGEAALAIGENQLVVEATDDLGHLGAATVGVLRQLDDAPPIAAVAFPRDGQAVRMRRVVVRGTATDLTGVAAVTVELGTQSVAATLGDDGSFTAAVELASADNTVTITATDGFGNAAETTTHIYYGQRLGAGGAHGGAIVGGQIYAWGRNNLGQTGLDYVSHESRTTYCERTLATPAAIAQCKATTVSAADAICLNPAFVTPTPADSPEAATCRATVRAHRDAVCAAAGAGAPTNCATSSSANLATACDAAYGAGTPASGTCEAAVACAAYADGTAERAACVAAAGAVPSVFPAPATPYAPVAVNAYSLAAAPPAAPGTGVAFASLGVAFTTLAFNQNAASALDAAGDLWSWGDGANGMLCLGDTLNRQIPHRAAAFGAAGTTAIGLSRGYDHVLVLRSDGTVWGCGLNTVGQIGDGTSGADQSRAVPTQVLGLPADVIQVVAASASSYALTAGGQVWAWGRNQYGNLGQGTSSTSTAAQPVPLVVPGLTGVVMLATGRDHVLAATATGEVYAWGLNASNQVDASDGNVLSPVLIAGVTDARAVYANGNQGFYENAAGQLLGWGQNGSGNLGIPDDDDQVAPSTPVFGLTAVLDVAIGALQGFAMRGTQVFAWGWSFHGSLGAGASAIHTWPYRTPVLVQLP